MGEFKQCHETASRPGADVTVQTTDGPRTFRLHGLGRRFRALVDEHQADVDAVATAVLRASAPELDDETYETLPDEALEALAEAAWALNRP